MVRGRAAVPLAAAAFVVLAALVTWPYALRPATTLIGPLGFDVSSSVAKFATIVREGTTPFSDGRLDSIAAPVGVGLTPGLDAVSLLSSLALWFGAGTVGAVASHGAMSLLGMALTATVAFALVRSLTGSLGAALVAGVAAGFFPHMRLMTVAAQTYTHMWLYLLPLWAAVALVRRPDRRRALLAGLSALPALFWTPYYSLHVLVAMVALGAVVVALLWRSRGRGVALAAAGWTALPTTLGVALYGAIGVLTSFGDVPARDPGDLYAQAGHPLMFLLPGDGATLWGERPYDALVAAVPRAEHTNLYLGLSVLALALVALVWSIGRLRVELRAGTALTPAAVATVLAAAVVLLAIAWSLPPTVPLAGLDLSTPARITAELAPALRAGQRFVMLAMPAAAVMAGIGLWVILRRIGPRWRVAVVAVAALAIWGDLAINVPEATTPVPRSAALAALADQPDAPAAHFQNNDPQGLVSGPIARPCVFQIQHGQALINPCNLNSDLAVLNPLVGLGDGSSCEALLAVHRLGARYLIIDSWLAEPACPALAGARVVGADEHFRVLDLGALGS